MKYMLDTNICIYLIKKKTSDVIQKFMEHNVDDICVSSITCAEMMYGVEKSLSKEKNYFAYTMFMSALTVLDFDAGASEEYGRIRADLEKKGTPIGPMDMLIAGHAKSKNMILVTNNMKEFMRVDGLQLENWMV